MEVSVIKQIHKWTQEENDYIVQNYKKLSKQELCKKFDVSMSSMIHKD